MVGTTSVDLQDILTIDPHAHFHVDAICCDGQCLSEEAEGVFYPSWSDLWQQQKGGIPLRDHVFRVFCKSHPGFNLAVQHHCLVLLPANTLDLSQVHLYVYAWQIFNYRFIIFCSRNLEKHILARIAYKLISLSIHIFPHVFYVIFIRMSTFFNFHVQYLFLYITVFKCNYVLSSAY